MRADQQSDMACDPIQRLDQAFGTEGFLDFLAKL